MAQPDNPLIIQSDLTILAEVDSPRYAEARTSLARFAELVKMPEHVHTYRLTPLSLWNACASGLTQGDMLGVLEEFAKYALPPSVPPRIREITGRFGMIRLTRDSGGSPVLEACHPALAEELSRLSPLGSLLRLARMGSASSTLAEARPTRPPPDADGIPHEAG